MKWGLEATKYQKDWMKRWELIKRSLAEIELLFSFYTVLNREDLGWICRMLSFIAFRL